MFGYQAEGIQCLDVSYCALSASAANDFYNIVSLWIYAGRHLPSSSQQEQAGYRTDRCGGRSDFTTKQKRDLRKVQLQRSCFFPGR